MNDIDTDDVTSLTIPSCMEPLLAAQRIVSHGLLKSERNE